MAKIGLKYFRYSILTEGSDGTPTYDGAKIPGKAVTCNVTINNNSATLYADDVLAESDTTFSNGTVTMEIDEDDLQTMATLLGHSITEAGEITRNSSDVAPYVGLGRIVVKLVNNVRKYKVEFLYKVKFSEPSQANQTKGESVEFATTSIEGTVSALKNGDWSVAQTFATESEAMTYLEGLMTTSTANVTLTYNANGGTGTIEPVSVAARSSVTLNNGSSLTPPTGKQFLGWATTSTASTPNVTSPYTVTENTTLYAVWTNANQGG